MHKPEQVIYKLDHEFCTYMQGGRLITVGREGRNYRIFLIS